MSDVLVALPGYKLFPNSNFWLQFTVTLPYTKAEFNPDVQTKYKQAVAKAAGTVPGNVDIEVMEAGSITVDTKIRCMDEKMLEAIKTTLGNGNDLKTKLNAELKALGLKEATKVTVDPLKNEVRRIC